MKKNAEKHGFRIKGPFYPWLIEMGNSKAMFRLRKNSDAVNVLTMFIDKFTTNNQGKGLSVTYGEVKGIMSPTTFAKAKLWCMAFGFLHCKRYGRLERKPSIYDLSTKWRHLSGQPEKFGRIEELLKRHERILRTSLSEIKDRNPFSPKARKKKVLNWIEKEILGQ